MANCYNWLHPLGGGGWRVAMAATREPQTDIVGVIELAEQPSANTDERFADSGRYWSDIDRSRA